MCVQKLKFKKNPILGEETNGGVKKMCAKTEKWKSNFGGEDKRWNFPIPRGAKSGTFEIIK